MKYFQEERVKDEADVYTAIVSKACNESCIAIDDEGKAEHEYYQCCKPSPVGLNLSDWIADQLVSKTIRMFPMNRSAEKELIKLGVPRDDLKWPSIAKGAEAEIIVTEDIDLFEPKAKKYNAASKLRIKSSGGTVSHHLKKKHGIYVMTAETFLQD